MDFNELERMVNEAVAERDGQISLLSEHLEAAKSDLEAAESKVAEAEAALDGAALVAAQTERDAAEKTVGLVNRRLVELSKQPVNGQAELQEALQDYMTARHGEAWKQVAALVNQMQEISAALDDERANLYRLGAKIGMRDYGVRNRGVHEVAKAAKEHCRRVELWG